jgi:hypothetical protein
MALLQHFSQPALQGHTQRMAASLLLCLCFGLTSLTTSAQISMTSLEHPLLYLVSALSFMRHDNRAMNAMLPTFGFASAGGDFYDNSKYFFSF